MEFILLALAIMTVGNPRWLGRHLSKTKQWYDYYQRTPNESIRNDVIRQRAKNIRRIRNERFRKMTKL